MKLKLKKFEVSEGRPIIFLHKDDAREIDININDRAEIIFKDKKIIGRVDILDNFLKSGEVALSDEIIDYLNIRPGEHIELRIAALPRSASLIMKKTNGKHLTREEMFAIVKDIVDNALTEVEIAQFVVANYKNGMSHEETIYLTEAMYKTGSILSWNEKIIADKHSIGGIAGNRTTPIVVSICAAAGVIMPKTSSRAITSAAGTADTIETLAKVDFPASKLKEIVKKTNACLAWGGSLGLAPADDKLIKVERMLNLDPEGQLLASILSKKLAVGSTHVLIDIPYGERAKVTKKEAAHLRNHFLALAKDFHLKMKVILTDGSQPIGNGIGPVLEMLDILRVLKQDSPPIDLQKKAILLAGELLELVGKAKKSEGNSMALEILESGLAYKKFEEIISAQGRKKNGLKLASYKHDIRAKSSGEIQSIDNKAINFLAAILGCPYDKGSGIYLHKHVYDKIEKNEALITFYSDSKEKLRDALQAYNKKQPITIWS